MSELDQAWQFLKDYRAFIPGVPGDEGPQSMQTIVDQPTLGQQRFRDRFFDEGTKQRQRAYKQQQKAAQAAWDDYLRQVREFRFGGPQPQPPTLGVGGVGAVDPRQVLTQPGSAPELYTARKKELSAADQKRKNITRPEHLIAGTEQVRKPFFGQHGSYWRDLVNWGRDVTSPSTGKTTRVGEAAFLRDKLAREGHLSPDEYQKLVQHYADLEPKLLHDAAVRAGLLRRKPKKAGEKESEPDGELGESDTDEGGSDTDEGEGAEDASSDERKKRKVTSTIAEGIEPTTGSDVFNTGAVKHAKQHDKKLKDVWGDSFGAEFNPEDAAQMTHRDFVDQELYQGKHSSYAEKFVGRALDAMSPGQVREWLKAHPGWEDKVPDDFKFLADKQGGARTRKKKKDLGPASASSGGTDDDEVTPTGFSNTGKASVHQIPPLDAAWALLKIGE